jgi:hypothetical protein
MRRVPLHDQVAVAVAFTEALALKTLLAQACTARRRCSRPAVGVVPPPEDEPLPDSAPLLSAGSQAAASPPRATAIQAARAPAPGWRGGAAKLGNFHGRISRRVADDVTPLRPAHQVLAGSS